MADCFYIDADGIKQGPVNTDHLKELAVRGLITPDTLLIMDNGYKRHARSHPGLFGSATQQTYSGTQTSSGFFDIGFTRFITNTLTSFLWVLTIILAIFGCGGAFVYAANNDEPILFLIAPIAAMLFLLSMRMAFELDIVIFRIEKHLRSVEKNTETVSRIEEHLRSIREHYEKK